MSDVSAWSATDASNTAATPDGWPEGQSPASVNDCARAMMGAIKRWYDGTTASSTARPAFVARRTSTNQDMPVSTTTDCIFNTEDTDQGAEYDNATGIFTAPVAGLYHFDALIYLIPAGTNAALTEVFFSVNNNVTSGTAGKHNVGTGLVGGQYSNTGNGLFFSGSVTLKLAASDTVRVKWTAGTAGAGTNQLGANASFFSGAMLA
jgi:hypothetical protein